MCGLIDAVSLVSRLCLLGLLRFLLFVPLRCTLFSICLYVSVCACLCVDGLQSIRPWQGLSYERLRVVFQWFLHVLEARAIPPRKRHVRFRS